MKHPLCEDMDWGPPRSGQGKGGKATRFAVKGAVTGRGKGGFGPSAGRRFQDFVQLTVLRFQQQSDVSKNRGKTPKMDGENNGKPENPMNKWMIWGFSPIFGNTQ